MTETDYLESLLAPLRASFHAKRRDRVGLADEISRTLSLYLKAVDNTVTRELCKAHGLPTPPSGDSPPALAAELLRLVRSLPELKGKATIAGDPCTASEGDEASPSTPSEATTREREAQPRTERRHRKPSQGSEPGQPGSGSWPELSRSVELAPLVIVGGPPHMERLNGVSVASQVEWIDTTRQGTHAIGNLERRIRDHRIGGLIVLEGLVQHRHTDPLISAARAVGLAHCFAGKGGRTALLQALDQLEARSSSEPHVGSSRGG